MSIKRETMIVNSPMGMDLIVFGSKHFLNDLRNKEQRIIRQIKAGLTLTDRIFITWESGINDKEKVEIKSYLKGKILGEMSIEDFDKMFKG